MHACLHVDEIVRLIANELVASQDRTTAVALARSCRGFEDPVLDALWGTYHQLAPLLKTFPEDIWNDKSERTMCFRRLPTTSELARFRKYARRIRRLGGHGSLHGYLNGISSEVFSVLQRFTSNEPLLPNLKYLKLSFTTAKLVPFIPLFVSPTIIHIDINFEYGVRDIPKALVASTITTLPMRCPNLQFIGLCGLPRDPMITAAVSEMALTTNRHTLRSFEVYSPLTDEAREVIHKLTDLCGLTVATEGDAPLPPLVLPNITDLTVCYDRDSGWLQLFHGTTLGNLKSIEFFPESQEMGDFLGTFSKVALATSIQNTLSRLYLYAEFSWNPNFSSLLPFTQLKVLSIQFCCENGCSSTVDDDMIISLARAMPKLESLQLGDLPCRRFSTGVTTKGLVALARYCPNLSHLCIHFQVASLSTLPTTAGMAPDVEPTALRKDISKPRVYFLSGKK